MAENTTPDNIGERQSAQGEINSPLDVYRAHLQGQITDEEATGILHSMVGEFSDGSIYQRPERRVHPSPEEA